MQLQQGRIVAGKYVLERPLGRGGMGEVWVARHARLGSPVALKVMNAASAGSPEARRRFEREAKIVANLRSDFIAHVFDHGDDGGVLFMAMELLEGEDLHERLRRVGRLPVPEAARIAVTVGRALRTAHAAGLVHRDLKPHNIFLAHRDGEEIVKVLDFGIVKVAGGTAVTMSGEVLGTLVYMSPEHLRSASTVDHRADLWSLAVVLYRVLTGELPFSGESYHVLFALAQDPIEPPPVPSGLVPGLPVAFDAFFARAFATAIDERFRTAADLVESFCQAAGQGETAALTREPLSPRELGGAARASTTRIAGAEPRPSAAPSGSPSGESAQHEFTREATPARISVREHVLSSLREGRYLGMDELGRGGMGRVEVVLDRALGRSVARKSVLDPGGEDMLLTEAQIVAQLEHPSIVPVYDVGLDAQGPHYTMRVVRGPTLRDALVDRREGRDGAMSLAQCLGVLRQVCLAVDFAHSRGVVHRDLKPENIIIGLFGEVYVLDWGVSQVSPTSDLYRVVALPAPRFAGTIGYMAPEQMTGGDLDARTDVYALGIILREVLQSGRPPDSRPRGAEAELGAPFDELLAACRATERDRRPRSARVIADAIDAYLDGERERAARRRDADQYAREGAAILAEVADLDASAQRLEAEAEALLASVKPWDPVEQKQPAWERTAQAARLRAEAARALARAETALAGALGRLPGHSAARRGLAALYYRQFVAAEARADAPKMAQTLELARAYDDGALSIELRDEGLLEVVTPNERAAITIARYEQRGLLLQLEGWRDLGLSPVRGVSLPSGSYMLVARANGREVRYPIVIERAHRHALSLAVSRAAGLPPEMVLVPGGPFLALPPRSSQRTRAHLPDFAIARFPVTLGDYARFLSSIEDPDLRRRRTPVMQGQPLLVRGPDREWQIGSIVVVGEGRKRVPPGSEMKIPVLAVTWYEAVAYAAWLSRSTGLPYRLPSDLEWEKAARGADGRAFPMGNQIDPALAKLRESRPEQTQPEPIGAFPTDESPHGVRDLTGGAGDWTSTTADGLPLPALDAEGTPGADARQAYYRGGSWGSSTLTHMRYPTGIAVRHNGIGLRVALDLHPEHGSDLVVSPLR